MKYVVVSDTHGDLGILEEISAKFQGKVDAMLYCGDSELPADAKIWENFQSVKGNCDYDMNYPDEKVLEFGSDRILLVHGHLHAVNFGLTSLSLLAREEQANLVFFGHTHQLGYEYQQGCLYLNPGSISYPRGQFIFIGGTFAIVETSDDEIKIDYYNREYELVPNLSGVIQK